MDPLAAPLVVSLRERLCPAGLREAGHLSGKTLGHKTHVVFAEDLGKALKASPSHRLDLVIGKHSVVRYDAAEYHLRSALWRCSRARKAARRSRGWFIVPKDDPAKTITDLRDYTILFGPADCDEKHSAAIAALTKAGITVPAKVETRAGCSDSALDILENKTSQRMAGVISSYAPPLLEGCGTVPKGSLRVVGHTGEVPFIGVFATAAVNENEREENSGRSAFHERRTVAACGPGNEERICARIGAGRGKGRDPREPCRSRPTTGRNESRNVPADQDLYKHYRPRMAGLARPEPRRPRGMAAGEASGRAENRLADAAQRRRALRELWPRAKW